MKVEEDVLGSSSLIVLLVSVDAKKTYIELNDNSELERKSKWASVIVLIVSVYLKQH